MIKLHLGIGLGDVTKIEFHNKSQLIEYISEIGERFDHRVWLMSNGGEKADLFVTEDIELIQQLIFFGFANFKGEGSLDGCDIHLHEYNTYEDAYVVSLDMREGNPLQ